MNRSTAVFSQKDFPLIQKALTAYAKSEDATEEEKREIGMLYHRLSRILYHGKS